MFFPPLSHFSTTCMHSAITGISSPPSFPKTYLSKPNQWVLMHMTAGPHVCCYYEPKLPFQQILPRKQMKATVIHWHCYSLRSKLERCTTFPKEKDHCFYLCIGHCHRAKHQAVPGYLSLGKGFFVKWCNTKDQAYIKAIYPSMAATLTASNTTPLDQTILNNSCINS